MDPLPVADVYVLMEVIHDWPDAEATNILSAIRDVAPAGATVLITLGLLVPTALYVHPQTVRYRMGQLREAFGDLLEDPDWVLRATIALGLPTRDEP